MASQAPTGSVHVEIPKECNFPVVGQIVRGFEILKYLGGGGFGQVYEAKRLKDSKNFALKVLTLPNGEITKEVAREMSLMYDVHHQNIVRLVTVFTSDDFLCLVMELVSDDLGGTIGSVSLDLLAIKKILYGIIQGVGYLHERHIIHRDLKPANILISGDTVKIADFGISRPHLFAGAQVTPLEATPDYSAPELLMGSNEYTTAIDMWSIGCIFAYMLEGDLPFDMMQALFEDMFDSKPASGVSRAALVLKTIFRKLGTPTENFWPGVTALPHYPKDLDEVYPQKELEIEFPLDDEGKDLLNQLLHIYPQHRISAARALEHPFLRGVGLSV